MTALSKAPIRTWLRMVEVVIIIMVLIGGVTRLTHSGLSIVEWKPLMGSVPPLSHEAWVHTFEQYKHFPQYLKMNRDMTLSQFKGIYFWEYLHRLVGRILGMLILLPYAWFVFKKKLTPQLRNRGAVMIGLVIAQAVMGWLMVKSGLVDQPNVSHFRLAAHLGLALTLYSYVFLTRNTLDKEKIQFDNTHNPYNIILKCILFLIIVQIIYGAFVAGLKAGFFMNTFPKMNGEWIPQGMLSIRPVLMNIVSNPVTIQWIHRTMGVVITLVVWVTTAIIWSYSESKKLRQGMGKLSILGLVQVLLGISTLVWQVPIFLAVIHQLMAIFVLKSAIELVIPLTSPPK